ncbi:alkaline phosphatase 4 isoform X1 [Vespula maculifrons]|uniref:Alkaline phosphatase 4 isoform X1 n=1 Tax=Vespula maculifrons TaxID=7453 RepID=A0ABD2BFF2_VESMC
MDLSHYLVFAISLIQFLLHSDELILKVLYVCICPYSHLFRSTFEQNYIAHVIAYAACFKDWPSHCDSAYSRYFYELSNTRGRSTAASSFASTYTIFTILILMSTLMRP